jgi:hypothetical protein
MTAMFIFIFPIEGVSIIKMAQRNSTPGDYSFDPLRLFGKNDKEKSLMRLKEVSFSCVPTIVIFRLSTLHF